MESITPNSAGLAYFPINKSIRIEQVENGYLLVCSGKRHFNRIESDINNVVTFVQDFFTSDSQESLNR